MCLSVFVRERERYRVCVCVSVCEREREAEHLHSMLHAVPPGVVITWRGDAGYPPTQTLNPLGPT